MAWVVLLFFASILNALTLTVDSVPKDASIAETLENPLIGPVVLGIAVSGNPDSFPPPSPGVQIDLPDAPFADAELAVKLEPFLGRALTQNRLDRMKETILLFYEKACRPIVSVFFPEQDICGGHLRICVVEGCLECYQFTGLKYISPKRLEKMIGIQPGEPIDIRRLESGLAWWNRNPFRYTNAVFSPGSQYGTTNIELITKESIPFRPFGGADNTGNRETGYGRLFCGIQVGSIFGFDQVLNYQYTVSTEWGHFWAHTASYALPLAKQHQLFFFGGYSHLKAKLTPSGFQNTGRLTQISGRYQLSLNPIYGSFLHELNVGYDFKKTNTGLFFGELTVSTATPEINQFMAGYYLDYKTSRSLLSFNAEIFASPALLTGDQNNSEFQTLRPFAKAKYVYGRSRLSYTQFFPHEVSVALVGMGQYANQNLLPSEQLGLGGYATVRGYAEREVNGDSGAMLSGELRAPPLAPVKTFVSKKVRDELLFYGFVDYGLAYLHHPIEGEKQTVWLMGTGPGMKYSLGTNFSFRAEYGFALHKTGVAPDPMGRWHLGGIVSY